jgi:hypothetical protein
MEAPFRQAYLDKINARVKEIGANLDQLKAKADRVDAETKIKYQRQIENLSRKKLEVQTKLNEINLNSGQIFPERPSSQG